MALGIIIKSEKTVEPLIAHLEDEDPNVQRIALGGLAQGLEETYRKLFSLDLDGFDPFLDPQEYINNKFAETVAPMFKLIVEDVKVCYETLAVRFVLRLNWRADDHLPIGK